MSIPPEEQEKIQETVFWKEQFNMQHKTAHQQIERAQILEESTELWKSEYDNCRAILSELQEWVDEIQKQHKIMHYPTAWKNYQKGDDYAE